MRAKKLDERYTAPETQYGADFTAMMEAHVLWLNTNGREGSRAIFMHTNFAGLDFSGLSLSYVVFKNCNLRDTIFPAEIRGADFTYSDLTKAVFEPGRIEECNFTKANLRGAVMESLRLISCDFSGTAMVNISFIGAEITDCKIESAEVLGCDFEGARLQGTTVADSCLLACSFINAKFTGVKFSGCDFGGSDFENAGFDSCAVHLCKFQVFEHKDYEPLMAELQGAKFKNCDVKACHFPKGFTVKNVKEKSLQGRFRRLSFFATNKSINIVTNIFVLSSIAIIASGIAGFLLGQMNYISRFFYAVSIFLVCNTYAALIAILQKRLLNALDATNPASAVKIESSIVRMLYGFAMKGQHRVKIYGIFFLPSLFLFAGWVTCLFEDNVVLALVNFFMCFYSFAASLLIFRAVRSDLEKFIRN